MSNPSDAPAAAAPAANPAVSALKTDTKAASTTSGPSTAASSPAPTFNTESAEHNARVSLADLCAKGTSHYAHKQYEEAAEYFARAAELQAEINGEMSVENGEVLFLYGRSLFRLGQGKSDVLGGRSGGQEKKPKSKRKKEEVEKPKVDKETVTEAGVAIMAEGVDKAEKEIKDEEEHKDDGPKKPLFQFTGDENFEDSDSEGEDAEGEEEEEEEDELATAFEVLDLARVLFTRKLDTVLSSDASNGASTTESKDKGKGIATKPSGTSTPTEASSDTPLSRHIKERLADTHDLLAEISLENERFPNAVADFKESLKYKQKLYPFFSEIIAEAHYKLSLALEFASITTTQEAQDKEGEAGAPAGETATAQIDEKMREEAAEELTKAIESTEGKLREKEVELVESNDTEGNDLLRKQIADVKEIVADMKQRVSFSRTLPYIPPRKNKD